MFDPTAADFLLLNFEYVLSPEKHTGNEYVRIPCEKWASFSCELNGSTYAVLKLDMTYQLESGTTMVHTVTAVSFPDVPLDSVELQAKGRKMLRGYTYNLLNSFLNTDGTYLPPYHNSLNITGKENFYETNS